MSIVAADLVAYASANMPEDDSSANGGGIDVQTRLVFTDITPNGRIEVKSSSAGDTTQTASVTGRLASGSQSTEVLALTGTSVVTSAGTFERIEKIVLSATCAGIITLQKIAAGGVLGTVPIGELGFRRLFIAAFSDPSAPKPYYMKFFWKNTHGSLAYLSAIVKQNADPEGINGFALEDAVNDTHTTANRITGPSSHITAFGTTQLAVPGTDLAFSAAIGVWIKMSLITGNAAFKDTYTSEIDGSTV